MADKCYIDSSSIDVFIKQLEKLNGNVNRAVDNMLIQSQEVVAKKSRSAMIQHNKTGDTSRQILHNQAVEWENNVASIDVGFELDGAGINSVYLMYGTQIHGQPHIKPDKALFDAVYGKKTKDEIIETQRNVMSKMIERTIKK